jgi:hypothetical protein
MFDWQTFVEHHNIPYIEQGPHTAKGNIYVQCIFCGDADSSYHMGLDLKRGYWGCWRNSRHRGKRPAYLVARLLSITLSEAIVLTGGRSIANNFASQIAELVGEGAEPEPVAATKVKIPPYFKYAYNSPVARLYLRDRGFRDEAIPGLCQEYDLRFTIVGEFSYRVLFMLYDYEGLATWTGRSIGDDQLRYRTMSTNPEKATREGLARRPITELVFNEVELLANEKQHMLIVCEGPFDAMKLDWYGYDFGMRATCLFGLNMSTTQIATLAEASSLFKHRYLCLDRETTAQGLDLAARLAPLGFKNLTMKQHKDPGQLSGAEIMALALSKGNDLSFL